MGVGERQRRKTASFSSSLLDTICHSIDDEEPTHSRNNTWQVVEQEVQSLRRAIMVEKWMQTYSSSSSSTDSASEAESSVFHKPKFRANKMYADLNKAKEPVSPRAKIASFLSSIFSPRRSSSSSLNKKKNPLLQEWNSLRKSRSIKHTSPNKTPSSGNNNNNNSKRCVRFVDESMPAIGSQFIKKNIDSFRMQRKHEFSKFYEKNDSDFDDKSCASSDLFELENINARIGIGAYEEEELPVYGTTNLKQLIM